MITNWVCLGKRLGAWARVTVSSLLCCVAMIAGCAFDGVSAHDDNRTAAIAGPSMHADNVYVLRQTPDGTTVLRAIALLQFTYPVLVLQGDNRSSVLEPGYSRQNRTAFSEHVVGLSGMVTTSDMQEAIEEVRAGRVRWTGRCEQWRLPNKGGQKLTPEWIVFAGHGQVTTCADTDTVIAALHRVQDQKLPGPEADRLVPVWAEQIPREFIQSEEAVITHSDGFSSDRSILLRVDLDGVRVLEVIEIGLMNENRVLYERFRSDSMRALPAVRARIWNARFSSISNAIAAVDAAETAQPSQEIVWQLPPEETRACLGLLAPGQHAPRASDGNGDEE